MVLRVKCCCGVYLPAVAVGLFLGVARLAADVGEVVVTCWPDDRTAAISITHDDNRPDHYNIAGPALAARGFRGTFNVNPGVWPLLDPWYHYTERYGELAQQGHELASHTMYHQHWSIVPAEQDPNNLYFHSFDEMVQDCLAVKAVLDPLQAPRLTKTFTYPWGAYGDATPEAQQLIMDNFLSARSSTLPASNSSSPGGWYWMYTLRCCPVGYGTSSDWDDYDFAYLKLTSYTNLALSNGGWVLEMYHDIHLSATYGLNAQAYSDHLDDLATAVANRTLWVAPEGDVARYIDSRNAVSIEVQEVDPQRIRFTAEDGLPDGTFDVPLTFRIEIPAEWAEDYTLEHNGAPLIGGRIESTPDHTYLYCSFIADGGPTVVALNTPGPIDPHGDMDCSGAANGLDIGPFVQALIDPAGYDADHDGDPLPQCDRMRGDMNGDEAVDENDIPLFIDALL